MVISAAPKRRFWSALVVAFVIALAAGLLMPLIGSVKISYVRAFSGLSPDHEILFYARLPRVLLAMLAGGTLATAGVLFQALLRLTRWAFPVALPSARSRPSVSAGNKFCICPPCGWHRSRAPASLFFW
jgi:ABC-type Fe3+-siderophore transport system permease subunit